MFIMCVVLPISAYLRYGVDEDKPTNIQYNTNVAVIERHIGSQITTNACDALRNRYVEDLQNHFRSSQWSWVDDARTEIEGRLECFTPEEIGIVQEAWYHAEHSQLLDHIHVCDWGELDEKRIDAWAQFPQPFPIEYSEQLFFWEDDRKKQAEDARQMRALVAACRNDTTGST